MGHTSSDPAPLRQGCGLSVHISIPSLSDSKSTMTINIMSFVTIQVYINLGNNNNNNNIACSRYFYYCCCSISKFQPVRHGTAPSVPLM